MGDLGLMKSFRTLQGSIRSLCFDSGSGLMYTSATADLNCSKLQKYILYELYTDDIKLTLDVNIEEGIGTAFIPAGKDSPELICASTGANVTDILQHFEEYTPVTDFEKMNLQDDQTSSGVDDSKEKSVGVEKTIEDEQEWLTRLKKFVALAEATTSEGTSSTKVGMGSRTGSDNALGSSVTEDGPSTSGLGVSANNKRASVVGRRSSRAAIPSSGGAGDATDFFKNLLDSAGSSKK